MFHTSLSFHLSSLPPSNGHVSLSFFLFFFGLIFIGCFSLPTTTHYPSPLFPFPHQGCWKACSFFNYLEEEEKEEKKKEEAKYRKKQSCCIISNVNKLLSPFEQMVLNILLV
jgi:hypothetical protein